jgi:glycosyltransferase involved in cell wall biosynthesis
MKVAILTTDNRGVFASYEDAHPSFGSAPAALLQGFEKLPEVEIHVVSCSQRRLNAPEKIGPNIWFHSLHVPKIGWLRTGYQGCIRAVRKCLKGIQPDIVHGQGTERDCAISAVFSGFPSIITIHGNMRAIAHVNQARPFTFDWLTARLESFALPKSNGVVCITDYTRRAVASVVRKTWVVPNAVDAGFFEVDRKPSPTPLILCVGNVTPRKNQNFFIEALDDLRTEFDRLTVIFLGKALPQNPYAQEFFALLAERPWCRFEGFAGREQLKAYLARASVVALSSLEDNCPMVVLEGMAAGVPVVAAKVGGVPELITDGVTGLFCAPLDAQSIREAIVTYLQNPELAGTIARAARADALSRFLPERIASKHLEVYHEVLQTSS